MQKIVCHLFYHEYIQVFGQGLDRQLLFEKRARLVPILVAWGTKTGLGRTVESERGSSEVFSFCVQQQKPYLGGYLALLLIENTT